MRSDNNRFLSRSIVISCENDECPNPTSRELTPTEFSDWLNEGEFNCNSCGHELSVEGVELRCFICDDEPDVPTLSHIPLVLDERCGNCAGRQEWDVNICSFRVSGSWDDLYDRYDWAVNLKDPGPLHRKGRTDYWEGLVHFCDAQQFVSIYEQRTIKAAKTGLYVYRDPELTKAVCLTESTIRNWDDIKQRHGEYGFVFRKKDIIALGGAPAFYISPEIETRMRKCAHAVPASLWPYCQKLQLPIRGKRSMNDFLHEREWRVPGDIDLDTVRPFAVTFQKVRPRIDKEELILRAAEEFSEIAERGPEDGMIPF